MVSTIMVGAVSLVDYCAELELAGTTGTFVFLANPMAIYSA